MCSSFDQIMDAFKHWLMTGFSEKDPELKFEARDLARFFTRFNLEIGRIREDWSDSKMAKGVRHIHGSGSSYLIEVSRLPPCRKRAIFLTPFPTSTKIFLRFDAHDIIRIWIAVQSMRIPSMALATCSGTWIVGLTRFDFLRFLPISTTRSGFLGD